MYDLSLFMTEYTSNGRLAIILIDQDGEDFADKTVNLPEERYPKGCAFVDTNDSPWLEEFIVRNGLGEFTGAYGYSGFCSYPQYRFYPQVVSRSPKNTYRVEYLEMEEAGGLRFGGRGLRVHGRPVLLRQQERGTVREVQSTRDKGEEVMFRLFNKKEDPADYVFRRGHIPGGSYLFDDGTFGYKADPEFDISEFIDFEDWETQEFIESYWYGMLDGEEKEEAEKYIRNHFGGKLPIGNIYIDRWGTDGEFYQGGCFLYFEGETLRDYCYRNGEPYPVREIPEEVIEMFESGDFSQIRKWRKEVPELKLIKL